MGDLIQLPGDADQQVDFTSMLQGHVSQSIKQVFKVERARTIQNTKLRIACREYVLKDQFGNIYVSFTARLLDGELWGHGVWVAHPKTGLNKAFKQFGSFNDLLMRCLQDEAFVVFGRANVQIMRSRQAAYALNPNAVSAASVEKMVQAVAGKGKFEAPTTDVAKARKRSEKKKVEPVYAPLPGIGGGLTLDNLIKTSKLLSAARVPELKPALTHE